MKPLRTPALTPAMLVENPGNAPGPRCLQGNAALLRDPRKIWSPTCDSNAEAAVSETARYAEIPVSWGLKLWGDRPVSIRDQRVHSARCRPLHHNRHRCWSGWLDTIQRPPASDAGTLPAELHPACWLPHLESHQGPIAYRAIALTELYGSIEALQPSQATPDRCLADVTRACETEMRRPWRFHPGRKLAPRSGFEPLSSALTVRCLAVSAIAE